MTETLEPERFELQYAKVAPFPRARFLKFLSKLKVQSKDYGLVPFRLLGSQLYILDELCAGLEEGVTTFYILKARQLGASTFFLALDLFWAFEYKGLLGVFITHKEDSRDDFRAAIEVFFAEIPKGFFVRYVRHNRNLLILKNGSKFRYLIAGTAENRKGGLGRSGSANYVHATECAFYGSGDDVAEFRSQTSSLYPHRLQIYETTANGFNWFSEDWEIATKDPSKRTIFVGWWRDERNQLPLDHTFFAKYMPHGLATTLSPLERKRVRLVRELYGVEISLQQVAWYRWHLESEKSGDQGTMDQEHPWTPDDAFQATGSKFFTVEALTNITRDARKHLFQTYRYRLTHKFEETRVAQVNDPRAELRIWEDKSPFGYYAAGCDPAFGGGGDADNSVISIWRCYSDMMVQVAEYCTGQPSTYQLAWVLAHLCGYYGGTYCMPVLELTGGAGQAVLDELNKIQKLSTEMKPGDEADNIRNILKNMRHFFYKRIDSLSGQLVYHWVTTETLKRRVMDQMKNGVELGRMVPKSLMLCKEMTAIVNDDGYIAAQGRGKDDRVMAAGLAYQAWNTWIQPRLKAQGLSLEQSHKIEERGGIEPMERAISNYLKRINITVPT